METQAFAPFHKHQYKFTSSLRPLRETPFQRKHNRCALKQKHQNNTSASSRLRGETLSMATPFATFKQTTNEHPLCALCVKPLFNENTNRCALKQKHQNNTSASSRLRGETLSMATPFAPFKQTTNEHPLCAFA
jgi:hypothetical protein